MPRAQRLFVCQSCGAVQPRWSGRCDACGSWNSITEESAPPGPAKVARTALLNAASVSGLALTTDVMLTELKEKKHDENPLVAGAVS